MRKMLLIGALSTLALLAGPALADEPVAEPSKTLAAFVAEAQANCRELVPYLLNDGPGQTCEDIIFLRWPWQPADLRSTQVREAYAESDYGKDVNGNRGTGKDDPTSYSDGGVGPMNIYQEMLKQRGGQDANSGGSRGTTYGAGYTKNDWNS